MTDGPFKGVVSCDYAEITGFAKFNGGPHLCVDVPDGHFTITCRTSEGRQVTFAFCPYKANGPAQCIDIQNHNTNAVRVNGDTNCPIQKVIMFGVGNRRVDFSYTDNPPITLTTLILAPHEGGDPKKKIVVKQGR